MDSVSKRETAHNAIGNFSHNIEDFQVWLKEEAKIEIHPGICIVDGSLADGEHISTATIPHHSNTKESALKPTDISFGVESASESRVNGSSMGCSIRATQDLEQDEVILSVPRSAMLTPDIVAASDAGTAIVACIQGGKDTDFWGHFENTTFCESRFSPKIQGNAENILRIIVKERERALSACMESSGLITLEQGSISTRAPLLAFLIQQQFGDSSTHIPIKKTPLTLNHVSANTEKYSESSKSGHSRSRDLLPGTPRSFSPYVRTFPCSINLPLCWGKDELALLSCSIPGVDVLQEVALTTMLLASEYIALINAGIHTQFPDIFPPGLITWDRWVWACAMTMSRTLPASCFIEETSVDESRESSSHQHFRSPKDIWNELGVMIPFLDMLNHEEGAQVTWMTSQLGHPPRASLHMNVKKGDEIFTSYGHHSNKHLIQQYGFALLDNDAEQFNMGWKLADAIGSAEKALDDKPLYKDAGTVLGSTDLELVRRWWGSDRLALFRREVCGGPGGDQLIESLMQGGILSLSVFNDGMYDPILLSACMIATMPPSTVSSSLRRPSGIDPPDQQHMTTFRNYLAWFFSTKLEKLMSNIESGLRPFYPEVHFDQHNFENGIDESWWSSLSANHIFKASIQVEDRIYVAGSESCTFVLFDGYVRALKRCIDGFVDDDLFMNNVVEQLENLDFKVPRSNPEEELHSSERRGVEKEEKKEQSSRNDTTEPFHHGRLPKRSRRTGRP